MSKDYEYFAEFFNDPASLNNADFHEKIREWVEYMNEHAGEFNYLEDEEWRERRERVIEDIGRREDIREEFENFMFIFEMNEKFDDQNKIIVQRRWLAFMKTNQFEYGFTDEQIAEMEVGLNDLVHSVESLRLLENKMLALQIKADKELTKLDDKIFSYYEKTGKIPVVTTIKSKKKPSGN